MKSVLDTNFIINLIFEDQPFHKEAIESWKNIEKAYVPTVVVFELIYFLTKYKKIEWVYLFLSDEKVEYIETKLEDIYFALKNNPKSYDEFNDFIILHSALRLKAKLETFDKELKERVRKLQ